MEVDERSDERRSNCIPLRNKTQRFRRISPLFALFANSFSTMTSDTMDLPISPLPMPTETGVNADYDNMRQSLTSRSSRRSRRRTTSASTSLRSNPSLIFTLGLVLLALSSRSSLTSSRSSVRWLVEAGNNYNYNNYNNNNYNNNANNANAADDAVQDADEADQENEVEDEAGAEDEAERDADGQDDTLFEFEGDLDFDAVNIMPVSCVNYHNGHMIKFQFFEKASSLNCHFKNLGTFVVSIAHYMRAYFNYQALLHGNDFKLPGDVGFLNCVLLKETANSGRPLYAKIGCQHRDTYTSTKLQLLVYRDAQCSQPFYNDDEDKRNDGYDIDGYFLSNKVSFRPAFYSCQSCLPEEISDGFTKRYSAWYDDDYISNFGVKESYNVNNEVEEENAADDAAGDDDGSYFQANDDIYALYDDQYLEDYNNDDRKNYHYVNHDDQVYYNYKAHDDDFYSMDDDMQDDGAGAGRERGRRLKKRTERKELDASHSITAKETFKEYESNFHHELATLHRHLEDAANQNPDEYDEYNYQTDVQRVASWNMCDRVHHYGMWCDEDCQSLDTFRVDEWSRSDVFLLVIMCVFMGAMMLLIFAKRVKAYERAAMWGDEPGAPNPGLPPMAMLMIFAIVFTLIVVLAALKFVNETLVFAVVTCILLFIYMLKLTLFESRKPQFLPARSTRNHSLKEPFY